MDRRDADDPGAAVRAQEAPGADADALAAVRAEDAGEVRPPAPDPLREEKISELKDLQKQHESLTQELSTFQQKLSTKAQVWTTGGQALGQSLQGLGQILRGEEEAREKTAAAEATEFGTYVQVNLNHYGRDQKFADDMKQAFQKSMQVIDGAIASSASAHERLSSATV